MHNCQNTFLVISQHTKSVEINHGIYRYPNYINTTQIIPDP